MHWKNSLHFTWTKIIDNHIRALIVFKSRSSRAVLPVEIVTYLFGSQAYLLTFSYLSPSQHTLMLSDRISQIVELYCKIVAHMGYFKNSIRVRFGGRIPLSVLFISTLLVLVLKGCTFQKNDLPSEREAFWKYLILSIRENRTL